MRELSPAAKAGLLVGDVITAVNDAPVRTRMDLNRVLVEKKVGDKVKVGYSQGSDKKSVDVTLEANAPAGRPYAWPSAGAAWAGSRETSPAATGAGGQRHRWAL